MAFSIEDAISKARPDEENFIIGGASVYTQFLPLADRLYITRVPGDYEADTYFPHIGTIHWRLLHKEEITGNENSIPHSFEIYERLK